MNKLVAVEEVLAELTGESTVVVGGWGDIRKPMRVLAAIAQSQIEPIRVFSYAALDLDLLVGAGKVKSGVYGFISADGGAPFKPRLVDAARRSGAIELREMDEYMFSCQFKAAAERVPFFPIRGGIGTDVLSVNPEIRTIRDPYRNELVVAVPAVYPDLAILHANRADAHGNIEILGDPYFDKVFAKAAKKVFVSCEEIVDVGQIENASILGTFVDGVVKAPGGARPGSCYPSYSYDAEFLSAYQTAAEDPEAFASFVAQMPAA